MWSRIVLAAGFVAASAAMAQTSIDETKTIDPHGTVSVRSVAGSLQFTPWERAEVRVAGTLGEDIERVEFAVDEKDATITVAVPDENGGRDIGARLVIQVPYGASLEVSTVSADIAAQGAGTPEEQEAPPSLRLKTVSGDLDIAWPAAGVSLETVSGDVSFSAPAEAIMVKSVSGNIKVHTAATRTDISTVSGDIKADQSRIADARMVSVSGDIVASGSLAEDGSVEATAASGDVCFRTAGAVSAALDLFTRSGAIRCDVGELSCPIESPGAGKRLRCAVGNGAGHITLRSTSGNVALSAAQSQQAQES